MTGFFENLSDSVRRYREKSRRDFYADPTRCHFVPSQLDF